MSLISLFCILLFHIADSRLTRKTPPTYGDGVYTINGGGRPSPRTLSQAFMKGYDGLGSLKNRTALATFFGKKERMIAAFFTNIFAVFRLMQARFTIIPNKERGKLPRRMVKKVG